jgi:hypothetical protein
LSISAPLATAIQNARLNAKFLSIADKLRKKKCDTAHWCEARLAWDVANEASLSVWELEDHSRGENLVTRGIRLEPTGNEIVPTLAEWDKDNSPETLEIVRIAIWPPKFFDDPEAARVIEMHDDYLVPLFWLSPARLLARADSEGIRRPRSDWGYDLIYARRYKDPNATDEIPIDHERPLRFVNDNRGKVPKRKYDEDRPDAYANDLWGYGAAPADYRRHDTHPSAEFSTLLKRPDILFAVDAYAMRCAGLLDDVTSTLNERYGLCDDWLSQ